jgi:hypothetical protein
VAHSSSGLGHLPLKEEITGSNPVCATKKSEEVAIPLAFVSHSILSLDPALARAVRGIAPSVIVAVDFE